MKSFADIVHMENLARSVGFSFLIKFSFCVVDCRPQSFSMVSHLLDPTCPCKLT